MNFGEVVSSSSSQALVTITYSLSYPTVGYPIKNLGLNDDSTSIGAYRIGCYNMTLSSFQTHAKKADESNYFTIGY